MYQEKKKHLHLRVKKVQGRDMEATAFRAGTGILQLWEMNGGILIQKEFTIWIISR